MPEFSGCFRIKNSVRRKMQNRVLSQICGSNRSRLASKPVAMRVFSSCDVLQISQFTLRVEERLDSRRIERIASEFNITQC
jgi:hypothetical protein